MTKLPLAENYLLDQIIHVDSIKRGLIDNDLPMDTTPEEWYEQLKEALRRVRGEGVVDAVGTFITNKETP